MLCRLLSNCLTSVIYQDLSLIEVHMGRYDFSLICMGKTLELDGAQLGGNPGSLDHCHFLQKKERAFSIQKGCFLDIEKAW